MTKTLEERINLLEAQIDTQQRTLRNINGSLEKNLKILETILTRLSQLERDVALNAL